MEEHLEELCNAIIVQAANDYKSLLTGKTKETARCNKKEIETFFESDWFKALSDADGKVLVSDLRKNILAS